jgi:hypothetical protein
MTENTKEFINRTMRKNVNPTIHIYIDETKDNENIHFAMTATATNKPQEFIKISNDLRKDWEKNSFEKYGVTPEELKDRYRSTADLRNM